MSATVLRANAAPLVPMAAEGSHSRGGARLASYDGLLLAACALVLSLGLVVMYSSSALYAARLHGDAQYFLKQQLLWMAVGLFALYVTMRVPGAWLERWALAGFVVSVALCALVLIPGLGHRAGGARRWLSFGPVGFQPSELAKLGVVVALAWVLARRHRRPADERPSLLVPVLAAQIPIVLVLAEPDLGTALVLELILALMVFSAGLRLRTLMVAGLAALPVLYHLVVGTPFRLQRLLSFIDPWAYRSTIGYQVTEALISIGSGGILGVGLGAGKHKLFFLPEAHTDFIFAILAEEVGLVGVVLLFAAFAVLLWRAIHAATHAATPFDSYLAMGVVALVGVPLVFNVGVVTGLVPTKGLPLPLVSYGGSNLASTLVGIGLVLRVERDSRRAGPRTGGA